MVLQRDFPKVVIGTLLVVCTGAASQESGLRRSQDGEIAKEFRGAPLVFVEDFEDGCEAWEPTDSAAWKVLEEDGNHVYSLFKESEYEPPVRSPRNISLIRGLEMGDVVIEAKLKQTGREYGHRDMCIFFGYVDPSHFYYVHIATTADAHANSIFLVNGAPRVSIATERTEGTDWGQDEYHTVRVTRDAKSGRIEVFFDDLEKPIMVAEDKTFLSGRIGFGSFDDTGNVDDVRVWGEKK